MELPISTVVGAAAFVAGLVFGATAQASGFCTMGALSDVVFMNDWRRFRSWMLAVAVAIASTHTLHATGLIDIDGAIYMTPNLGWLGAILGGLMFGFGMTMAGGCGNKILVRIGGGNLKSLVAAVTLGIFAYMTLRGLLALGRLELEGRTNLDLAGFGFETQGLAEVLSVALPVDREVMRGLVAAAATAGLLIFCFRDAAFRGSPRDVAAGLIIGLLVSAGWLITGVIGADDFDPTPLASFTFVAPIGEGMQYLMTFTGATIDFGIAAVGGVLAGSFAVALATRRFRIEAFTDVDDMLRHLGGAALMGVGGVLALGCTIGQGLTGIATLAAGSLIALISIIVGGVVGFKYLEEGSLVGAVRSVFARA